MSVKEKRLMEEMYSAIGQQWIQHIELFSVITEQRPSQTDGDVDEKMPDVDEGSGSL